MIIAITGISRGIGRALALHFAEQNHRVFGCSRSEEHPGDERIVHIQADLASPDGPRALFREIRRQAGTVDVLINNAGLAAMNHFMLMPPNTTRELFDVNVHGMLACSREAAILMAKSEYPCPSIVNFTTVATVWSLAGQLAYAASKGAVEQATRVMSRELASENIRVNAVGLPPVRTAMTRTVPHEKIEALIARQAIPRACEMRDIAGVVDFLISPGAGFVTGETLFLGGVH